MAAGGAMNTNDKSGSESSLKVKDRRRFDPEGNRREEVEPSQPKETPDPSIGSAEQAKTKEAPPELTFSAFVLSMATQAFIQLGEVPAPEGVAVDVNPVAAKQTIDILGMLKDKTAGNLDGEERNLIEDVLHNLRMSYLKRIE